MAFSLRKMLSNITYFKKPGEDIYENSEASSSTFAEPDEGKNVNFECAEPDSTSTLCSTSLKVPESVRNFAAKKGSLSDTDLLNINIEAPSKKNKRKNKKLKLDVSKCSQSLSESIDKSDSNVENTPTHVLLDSQSAELLGQHFKGFDFNHSFDIFDAMSDTSLCEEENVDIESLSDESETDISLESDISNDVQMCRKVDAITVVPDLLPSPSPESFGDVELEKNEQERVSMLLDYQMQLEKLDTVLKKLLTEFKFHIEVSKVFNYHSVVSTFPHKAVTKAHKMLDDMNLDKLNQGLSRSGSWNMLTETQDEDTKLNLKTQLISMKNTIEDFVQVYFEKENIGKCRKLSFRNHRSLTYGVNKSKHTKINYSMKKRYKHFDFPDIRDAMINLFEPDFNTSFSNTNHILNDYEDSDDSKCVCRCQLHGSSSTPNDSGLNTKNDVSSQSITSSIGNFSLDTSTLTAYSESLDLIISCSSFQDTSLYSTLLQKPAIERITFYVQVHSIQLKCETTDQEYESKNVITFYCPSCKSTENEESNLVKHILSQLHCEKIHFVYKTAYIKKCVASGKEIMPSTVLNPMTMYRDDNKIVCFGDAMYACSLCFENLIAGESVLMAHCSEAEHVERREKLSDMLD